MRREVLSIFHHVYPSSVPIYCHGVGCGGARLRRFELSVSCFRSAMQEWISCGVQKFPVQMLAPVCMGCAPGAYRLRTSPRSVESRRSFDTVPRFPHCGLAGGRSRTPTCSTTSPP
eukprot:3292317-Pyramimonas_sp.AAC.1